MSAMGTAVYVQGRRWIVCLSCSIVIFTSGVGKAMPPPPDPDPRVNLEITVQESHTYDAVTGLYTYNYTVTNNAGSGNSLKTFALGPIEYVKSIGAPTRWSGFDRWDRRIDVIAWTVTENVGALPPDSVDTGDMPPSPYCTPPGQATAGFSIVSRQPPGSVNWYAQGEDTLIHVEADPFEGLLDPDDGIFGLMSVKGTTIGPDIQSIVSVPEDANPASPAVKVRQARPNPFTHETVLGYELARPGRVRLEIFDIQGRSVRTLQDELVAAGSHGVKWSGTDQAGREAASGVYFVKVVVDGVAVAKQPIVLMR